MSSLAGVILSTPGAMQQHILGPYIEVSAWWAKNCQEAQPPDSSTTQPYKNSSSCGGRRGNVLELLRSTQQPIRASSRPHGGPCSLKTNSMPDQQPRLMSSAQSEHPTWAQLCPTHYAAPWGEPKHPRPKTNLKPTCQHRREFKGLEGKGNATALEPDRKKSSLVPSKFPCTVAQQKHEPSSIDNQNQVQDSLKTHRT